MFIEAYIYAVSRIEILVCFRVMMRVMLRECNTAIMQPLYIACRRTLGRRG